MTDLLARISEHWATRGIAHGSPISSADVATFEERYAVRLPADLRSYVFELNGSEQGSNGPMDDQLLTFWHLAEMRPLNEAEPTVNNHDAARWFVIADHSISVHEYVVALSADPAAPSPVAVVYDDFLVEVAPSFSAFLEGYLANDQLMLFPDVPTGWMAKYGDRLSNDR